MKNITNTTQEERVLEALEGAKGDWINGQYFLRTMLLSQYHRAIHNLQKNQDRYGYAGTIEASTFKDEHGFKSYRLTQDTHKLEDFFAPRSGDGMAPIMRAVEIRKDMIDENAKMMGAQRLLFESPELMARVDALDRKWSG